jgi:hypothetical protein
MDAEALPEASGGDVPTHGSRGDAVNGMAAQAQPIDLSLHTNTH